MIQGDHTVAYALQLERVINTVNSLFPTAEDGYTGVTDLIYEMNSVVEQDAFCLKEFFPPPADSQDKYDSNNKFILGQFGKNGPPWHDILVFRVENYDFKESVSAKIKCLNRSMEILQNLDNLHDKHVQIQNLIGIALDVKLEYCASIVTTAARQIIQYQNASPWGAFKKIPAHSALEKKFNATEGTRVKNALAALRNFKTENAVTDTIIMHIANLLYYPMVDELYSKQAIKEYGRVAKYNLANARQKKSTNVQMMRIFFVMLLPDIY